MHAPWSRTYNGGCRSINHGVKHDKNAEKKKRKEKKRGYGPRNSSSPLRDCRSFSGRGFICLSFLVSRSYLHISNKAVCITNKSGKRQYTFANMQERKKNW